MINPRLMKFVPEDMEFPDPSFAPGFMPYDQNRLRPFPIRRGLPMMSMHPVPEPEMHLAPSWNYVPPQPYMVMVPPAPQLEIFPPTTNEFAGVPIVRQVNPPRREFDIGGLSVHAKPWNPTGDKPASERTEPKPNDLHPPAWTSLLVNGTQIYAPSPLIVSTAKTNLFIHSVTVKPWEQPTLEFELFNYLCARCSIKTLFTKLSSRKADIVVYNVAEDIPPLCITHLIEKISKVRIIAVSVSESSIYHLNIWLDKPNLASQVVSSANDNVWICPMFHGYAIMPKNEEAKKHMLDFLEKCKASPEADHTTYPLSFMTIKEHQEKQKSSKKECDAHKATK